MSRSRLRLEYGGGAFATISGGSGQGTVPDPVATIETVSVDLLTPGESPRLGGQDAEHAARLAESDGPLPPILVERKGMRVVDGMHRLMAARLRGEPTIQVQFFDGSQEDAFLRAVQANVAHGLPLTLADRRAAAERIVLSHPHLSDRAIAAVTGLGRTTIAGLRAGSPADTSAEGGESRRIGKDGKVRPLNSAQGRARAAAYLKENPSASLREVAIEAGISPATVSDVRRQLERGRQPAGGAASPEAAREPGEAAREPGREDLEPDIEEDHRTDRPRRYRVNQGPVDPEAVLRKLMRDPSLRYTEAGRHLLKLLSSNAEVVRAQEVLTASVPAHCEMLIRQLAEHYAAMWQEFAQELSRSKA